MSKIIVTAGRQGADIDVLACVVAYAELLRLEGKEGLPVVAGNFTASVTPSILAWGAQYESSYTPTGTEEFVLVDISEPDHVPDFLDLDRVREVYDHRHGFETFWNERLGSDAHIEDIGACGTQIWEEFVKRGKTNEISETAARLLLASIVSNTLNFQGTVTTERDKKAYEELKPFANLPEDWVHLYFAEQETLLQENFTELFKTDTKRFQIGEGEFVIAQLELWDASSILETRISDIDSLMKEYEPAPWIVNIASISHGRSFLYSTSEEGKRIIAGLLDVTFTGNIAQTKHLVLRKEIIGATRKKK